MTALIVVSFPGAVFSAPVSAQRILTVRGVAAYYIAKARRVAPPPDLFDGATVESFEAGAPACDSSAMAS